MTPDPAATARLDALRQFSVYLADAQHRVGVDPPRCAAVAGLIVPPAQRIHHERALLRGELVQTIALDGTPIWAEQADLIIDDPSALAAVVAVRERVYGFLVEQGRAVAVCPTCAGTVDLDLAFYAVALRLPSWRVTDGAFLAVPGLAHPEPPEPPILRPTQERPVAARGIAPRPPRPPRAARIDFVLPSARTGLADADDAVAGSLADIEPGREAEAWRTWAPPDRDQPDERMYWAPSRAGFRAVLRLSVAVTSLRDSRSGPIEPTPGSVEHLFLADLQFLDALYTATHELPVETPANGGEPRGTVHCAAGHAFLPVR